MRPGLTVLVWLKALGNLLSVCFPLPTKITPQKSSKMRGAHITLASGRTCCFKALSSTEAYDFPLNKALIPISEALVINAEVLTTGWLVCCHLYLCSCTAALAQLLPLRAPLHCSSSAQK